MGIILKGGTLVLEDSVIVGDIKINNELITEIGEKIVPLNDDTVIDVTGKQVLPGVIDAHVHYKMALGKVYTVDNFETGSRAALCGGVTTVIDYAEPIEGLSLLESLDYRVKEAKGHNFVDFSVHMTISGDTPYNLEDIKSFRNYGVNSLKLYTTYDFIMGYDMIFDVLRKAKEAGMVVTIHAEDNEIVATAVNDLKTQAKTGVEYHGVSRPSKAEYFAVERIIEMCEKEDLSAHIVHVSSGLTGELISNAKARGVKISAETCPHYLMLNDEVYKRSDAQLYVMQPPLRNERERIKLMDELLKGTFDFVTTDHCAYSPHQKFISKTFYETNGGIPGTETLLPIIYSQTVSAGKMDLLAMSKLLATNPAKKFGLYPKKGVLKVGSYGDVVVIDPDLEVVLSNEMMHTAADYTTFTGIKLKGYPIMTILRGKIAYRDGKFLMGDPLGNFISC
ncbi:MAG: dihydropyrimidinase [Firmicutes bacterium]|nr:dihydropyrimidinase [Bacillota bacterium]